MKSSHGTELSTQGTDTGLIRARFPDVGYKIKVQNVDDPSQPLEFQCLDIMYIKFR